MATRTRQNKTSNGKNNNSAGAFYNSEHFLAVSPLQNNDVNHQNLRGLRRETQRANYSILYLEPITAYIHLYVAEEVWRR